MTKQDVDRYLDALPEPKRSTLLQLRNTIVELAPDAEEGIRYGVPAFLLDGKVVAGFAAFTHHLSYLPHSGSVFTELAGELAGYRFTKGSLHFPVDQPLPKGLVRKLLSVRLRQAFPDRGELGRGGRSAGPGNVVGREG